LTGNELSNFIYGNAGSNILSGEAGNDSLFGGTGNDVLFGGTGLDKAYFNGVRSTYSIQTLDGKISVLDNDTLADGDDGLDVISSIEQLSFRNGETFNIASPIILDIDGKGVETLSSGQSHARFDLNGDGTSDDTSWIGSTEGFLFIDRDSDGKVTDAGEISFIDDKIGALSDLDGLSAFDLEFGKI
jgi:Ca2+-binding RTX toxin-like protein